MFVFPELSSDLQFQFFVSHDQAGCRLDHFLVRVVPGVSRASLAVAVRFGAILVDGVQRKNSYVLKGGESVTGSLLPALPQDLQPEEVDFQVVFEDSSLLVLSKPPGLVVHPGGGHWDGTLVNGLLFHCQEIAEVGGDAVRPGLVHRLDKDTSGLMVVAKTDGVHRVLVDAFKNREVEKEYVALLHGLLQKKKGRVVAPIGRHPVHRQKMAVCEDGRFAATSWELIREFSAGLSLVRVHIETGRTHQIRVHMASLGHPVAGDVVYGGGRKDLRFPRQMLHSSRLSFVHPITHDRLDFESSLWPDFSSVLDRLTADDARAVKGLL